MVSDTLTLFVPYELDSRGRCCQSRVVVARAHELTRVKRHFEKQLENAPGLIGLVAAHYEWHGKHYVLTRSDAVITGEDMSIDDATVAEFEAFADTIHYYERLDEHGLPLPGDEPVLHYPEPTPWLQGGRHLPSARQRHRREPRIKAKAPSKVTFGKPVLLSDFRAGRTGRDSTLRIPKSRTHQPSPLYPSRSKPQIAYPPKGCHPFVKTRAASELALAKLPASIRSKGFHSYELCEFGDVPAATSRDNFLALKRRKGTVIGFYNFYRHPFAIVTDMKDRVAMLLLRTEL